MSCSCVRIQDVERAVLDLLTAGTTGVSVLEPGASHVGILLVDCELHGRQELGELNCCTYSRDTGTGVDDSEWPWLVDGSFRYQGVTVEVFQDLVPGGSHLDYYPHSRCVA